MMKRNSIEIGFAFTGLVAMLAACLNVLGY